MPIDNDSVVDFIASKADLQEIRLVVADHLEWNDEHATFLKNKIAAYIRYLTSGDLIVPPGYSISVWVRCQHPPRPEDAPLLQEIKQDLEVLDVGLLVDCRTS